MCSFRFLRLLRAVVLPNVNHESVRGKKRFEATQQRGNPHFVVKFCNIIAEYPAGTGNNSCDYLNRSEVYCAAAIEELHCSCWRRKNRAADTIFFNDVRQPW